MLCLLTVSIILKVPSLIDSQKKCQDERLVELNEYEQKCVGKGWKQPGNHLLVNYARDVKLE